MAQRDGLYECVRCAFVGHFTPLVLSVGKTKETDVYPTGRNSSVGSDGPRRDHVQPFVPSEDS